jgi:hypothetical protein
MASGNGGLDTAAETGTALNEPSLETKGGTKKKGKDTEVEKPDFEPFTVEAQVVGISPILFHAYDVEEVERKGNLPKGAKEKKVDNVESFVYRCKDKTLGIPGVNMKAALANAAKRFKDPSSPRKSAKDLIRAGVTVGPFVASLGVKEWDALDKRGVVVQQSRVTRSRPMLYEGWKCSFEIRVMDSEHITEEFLREIVDRAGMYSGLGDYRPDFGQFRIDSWQRIAMV